MIRIEFITRRCWEKIPEAVTVRACLREDADADMMAEIVGQLMLGMRKISARLQSMPAAAVK